jgi:predicted transcriptional regulator
MGNQMTAWEHRRPPAPATGRRAAGQLEAQVLGVLWAADGPLSPAQIHAGLDDGLAYNTVHTILTRLCEKGLLRRTVHEGHPAYVPTQEAADWAAGQMRAVLDRGADRGAILHRFVSGLDPDDERVLRAALREHDADAGPARPGSREPS